MHNALLFIGKNLSAIAFVLISRCDLHIETSKGALTGAVYHTLPCTPDVPYSVTAHRVPNRCCSSICRHAANGAVLSRHEVSPVAAEKLFYAKLHLADGCASVCWAIDRSAG
jgi:hypothetical protein